MGLAKGLYKATLAVSGIAASLLMSTNVHAASKGLPSNGVIAYPCRLMPAPGVPQNICYFYSKDRPPAQITFDGDNGLPTWDPTGTKLAYTNHFFDSTGNEMLRIMVMSTIDLVPKELSMGVAPAWSSDGKEIAFSKPSPTPPGMLEIWSIRPDGTHLRQLTDLPENGKRLVTWSPDGKYIAYTQDSVVNGLQHVSIWVARVNGSGARDAYELTTGKCPSDSDNPCRNLDAEGNFINFATDAGVPTWSPKGDKIAFWSGIENQRGQIWVIDPDGNNRTQLTFPDKPPQGCTMYPNNDDPRWAPDGKKILFTTNRHIITLPFPPFCGEAPELWQMNANGSGQEFIIDNSFGPFPGNAAYQPVP